MIVSVVPQLSEYQFVTSKRCGYMHSPSLAEVSAMRAGLDSSTSSAMPTHKREKLTSFPARGSRC